MNSNHPKENTGKDLIDTLLPTTKMCTVLQQNCSLTTTIRKQTWKRSLRKETVYIAPVFSCEMISVQQAPLGGLPYKNEGVLVGFFESEP